MKDSDIAVVMGTRPEMIKLAGVVKNLGDRARIIQTGQHFDDELSGQIQRSLGIPGPDVVLEGIGGGSRSSQIANCMTSLSVEFSRNSPSVVIVQGDTNTVSAAAQAANYAGVPLIHVEAGLRSYDRNMPEEINRLVAGVLSDVHCAATATNRDNLLSEGIAADGVTVTGNTIVEATEASLAFADDSNEELPLAKEWNTSREFVLATVHRPENTDTAPALERVLAGLAGIGMPVLFVAHPRTRAAMARFGLERFNKLLHIVDSVPHHAFLALARSAALLVSDSGGLQEECTVLKKPLLVIRRSTERPESVDAGFAKLIRPAQDIAMAAREMLAGRQALSHIPSPYGDGKASLRIVGLASRIADGQMVHEAVSGVAAEFPLATGLSASARHAAKSGRWEWM